MDDFCICGQAIGPKRFKRSIMLMQQSLITQGYKGKFRIYIDELPKGCPPHPSPNHIFIEGKGCVPYAFKAYIMKEAQTLGFRYVGYLDSLIYLQKPFSMIQKIIREKGYFFGDNGADLGLYTSDACLDYFGIKRKEILGKHCIHGGIMFLDLEIARCREFLDKMFQTAYPEGPYCADWQNKKGQVSTDSRVKGHRPQQSVATILAMKLGMTDFVPYSLTYEKGKPEFIFRMIQIEEGY